MKWFVYFVDAGEKDSVFGWNVIKFFADSPLVHAGLAFEEGGQIWCYETTSLYFIRRPLKERAKGTPLRFFEINQPKGHLARNYVDTLVGQPYDYPAILGLGVFLLAERMVNLMLYPLKRWAGLKHKKIRIKFENPYDMPLPQLVYCVESVLNGFDHAALRHPFKSNSSILPQVLYDFCISMPHTFIPRKVEDYVK